MPDVALLPKQKEFLDKCRNQRYVLFNAGIQSGKTKAGSVQDWIAAIENKPPHVGWVIAPTYAMTETVRKDFLDLMPGAVDEVRSVGGREIVLLKNGHQVEFRTGDNPDMLRGPRVGWFHVDEASRISKECMDILYGRVLAYRGRGWLTTTPAGSYTTAEEATP